MNILHLKYAVEVGRTGNITQAAENLFMAQSNLSKAIKDLENSLGFDIFVRSKKGVIATRKGSDFLNSVRNVLEQMEEIESNYMADKTNHVLFRVAVPRSYYVIRAFTNFFNGLNNVKNETRKISASFREVNSMETIACVFNGDVDLGIIRYAQNQERCFLDTLSVKSIEIKHIGEFYGVVLMHKNHELASVDVKKNETEKTGISLSSLDKYTEVIYGNPDLTGFDDSEISDSIDGHIQTKIYIYERSSLYEVLSNVSGSYTFGEPLSDDMLQKYSLVQKNIKISDDSSKDKRVVKDAFIYNRGFKPSDMDLKFMEEVRLGWVEMFDNQ